MRRSAPAAVLLALFALGSAAPAGPTSAPTSDLARPIARAMEAASRGDHRAMLALRQLRDPALRPLFAQLATSDTPERRLHGILGLAELDSPPGVDPFLVFQIKDPAEQLALLAKAREEGLLDTAHAGEALARPDLAPRVEAFLCVSAGPGAAEPQRLDRLASSGDVIASDVASALRAQAGSAEAAATLGARLRGLAADPSAGSRDALRAMLNDIRLARLTSAGPAVAAIVEHAGSDRLLQADAVAALLAVDPERGRAAWLSAWGASSDYADRLRLGMLALTAGATGSEAMLDALDRDERPLLRAMGAAATAVFAAQPDAAMPLAALVEHAHAPSVAWAIDRAADLPSAEAARVRLAAVELAGRQPLPFAVLDEAVRAASLLSEESPETLAPAFRTACDERRVAVCRAMLLGMLRATSPRAADALRGATPPDRETEALAALVTARATAEPDPALAERLAAIAAGWGGLSDARRAQAAWLALRHGGQARAALATILAPAQP